MFTAFVNLIVYLLIYYIIRYRLLNLCNIYIHIPGVPEKNATDLNNSNGSCFILVSKQLFLLKSAIIRMNFDIFSSTFGDLVVKLKISKVQNCFHVKTRAATLAFVD